MVRNDEWVHEWGKHGGCLPFSKDNVNPASYDLTISDDWINSSGHRFKSESMFLGPGESILGSTIEYVEIPRDSAADFKLKSTLGRKFINHSLAGWIDPGFKGNITLELQNIGSRSIKLEKGMKIGQLVFYAMEKEPVIAYGEDGSGSHYYGQSGTTRPYDFDKRDVH